MNHTGEVLGQHRGLHRYTIGQRRGIGIPSNTDNEFYVVTGIDIKTNQLIVGFEDPQTPGLYTVRWKSATYTLPGTPLSNPANYSQPRYRDPSQVIQYTPLDDGGLRLNLSSHKEP